jgi:putative ABC transport system ATP-binding protein
MIEFNNVCVRAGETELLTGVSFKINPGNKAVIRGKSGSGKSTILNTFMGVHSPCSGEILFSGGPVTAENIGSIRKQISFIAQEPLLGTDSVEEAVYLPFTFKANRDKRPSRKTVVKTLERLDLPEKILTSDSSVLSGGEKQRISIARSLLLGKEIFILDEVTSALDPESKNAVLSLFKQETYTILSVSHDPDWFTICDTFIEVTGGRVTGVEKKAFEERSSGND